VIRRERPAPPPNEPATSAVAHRVYRAVAHIDARLRSLTDAAVRDELLDLRNLLTPPRETQ
jgi:hypothetical protein